MDRRKMLKTLGGGALLAGVAPFIITSKKGAAQAQEAGEPPTVIGPPTKPFTIPLPMPVVAKPIKALNPVPDTSVFQFYKDFPVKEYYNMVAKEALHSFHPSLPLNKIWGYDGIFPGPHFMARYGTPMIVRIHNNLPANHKGYGRNYITTHLHNGHTGSESDGFTTDFYGPGKYHDHHYAQMLSGGDPNEALGTLWYHDHCMDFTATNTYRGLIGTYWLFDDVDSGDETDTNPRALRLPSGKYDIPIVLADKQFNEDGALIFDQTDMNGFVGDRVTVNGVIQPYFKVARRKYRLRFLVANPSRWYGIQITINNEKQPFQMIASDGNLLAAPIIINKFVIAPAERYDIVVDFSKYKIGDQILVQNYTEQGDGRGPTGVLADPVALLRFDVDRDAKDPSVVPEKLREMPAMRPVTNIREWNFTNEDGTWMINGELFDPERVSARIKVNTAEYWDLTSLGDWGHPVHIHREEFRIISRDGLSPAPEEQGRKDVIKLMPINDTGLGYASSARLYFDFRDMMGRYMMHCHNTVHEDHAMMIRFDVVP